MTITHNTAEQRFETQIDGHTAFLSYQVNGDVLDMDHTIVPAELGGRGIGGQLATAALTFAREHHKKVIPSCSFVAHFIGKNPQFADLIAD